MINLVFGVDGGQTSTKCVLATTEGQILARGEGGPLIHLASEGGREQIKQSLSEAFASAWRKSGIMPQPVEAVGLGLTGVEANTLEARVVLELVPEILTAGRVSVHSDAFAALMGAHMGEPGIIAISGTGSIVLGINAQGETARAGGWGWLVADEGSAVAIGRSALLAAFYAFDGVGPVTILEEILQHNFDVESMYDIKRKIYAGDFGQRGFSSLAPLVSRAAQQGDVVAAEIIRDAGEALAKQVAAVVYRLNFQSTLVAPIGGAFEHITGLREAFDHAIESSTIPTRVVVPKLPAVLGAVIMALAQCGVDLTKAASLLQSQVATGEP